MTTRFFFIAIALFLIVACSDDTPVYTNEWDEDVYRFGKELKDKHVDLFFNISESEFDSQINTLRANSGLWTEDKILFELSKIISQIGDSHTQIVFGSKLPLYPFRLQLFDDGILLIEIESGKQEYLGKKILSINDTTIEDVIDKFRKVISYENESNFKNQVVLFMLLADYYHQLEISDSPSEITLNFEDGTQTTIQAQNVERAQIQTPTTPLFLRDATTFYWFEELPEHQTLFIQYNACRERDELSFQSFTNQITNRINDDTNIQEIILDLRHNGGGNSSIMLPLIDALDEMINTGRFSESEIHLIIGRKTFSSAILNTLEIKEKINPILYGESSGGKPNHYGEVKTFQLPNSRLTITYSTKYFTHSDNEEDSIHPDVPIGYSSEHFLNGLDPVVEEILKI
ncbi:MAG: hypothetical protein AAGA77_24345 [Bacteroidota bacterium]